MRATMLKALLCCIVFVLLAVPWIDRPGIQTDEALFAAAIYPPFDGRFVVSIFKHQIPLMTMTYVGALKSHIWALLFVIWTPGPASVRIPAVLLGALSVWLVYRLLARTNGKRTAFGGAALLATDPIYVLYARWDHGPVVIQHLCLLGAMLSFVMFHQERRERWLGLGFFALGLGMWEKAVFVWLIIGLSVAGVALFARTIRSVLTRRNCGIAILSFTLGATPLLLFNLRHRFVTFRSNTIWSAEGFSAKVGVLRATLGGDVLFGSMMRDSWDGPIREPVSTTEKAVVAIATRFGLPRRDLMPYLAALTLILIPFVRSAAALKTAGFVVLCGLIAWLQMAFTQGAGGAAHHTILLWPLPEIGMAAILAAASERIRFGRVLYGFVISAVCVSNVLVLTTYYTNLLRNGGTSSWTDAMYPAFEAIRQIDKEAVCTIDWGFTDTVRLYELGRSHLCTTADPIDEQGRRIALLQISKPRYVFLTHTDGHETFAGITARFVNFALTSGFERVNHRVFEDSNGRKTVETFQFAKRAQLN